MSFQPFFRGFLVLSVLVSFSLLLATCGKKQDSSGESGTEFIYIASGTAYAGQGVTTSSASNTIAVRSATRRVCGVSASKKAVSQRWQTSTEKP